jgi:glutathione S-transferase
LSVAQVDVDLRRDRHLEADYLAINPRGTLPCLQLDTGEVIDESAAICRYFETLHPEPSLFGTTALDVARIEAWTRRIESDGYAPAVYALRNRLPSFADRGVSGRWPPVKQIPELVERARIMWSIFMENLDAHLQKSVWVAGEMFSFADITGLVTLDFAGASKLVVPEACVNVARWHAALRARGSAAA